MNRLYRYIDIRQLRERALELYAKIQYNTDHNWQSLSGGLRSELRKVNRELSIREKEDK